MVNKKKQQQITTYAGYGKSLQQSRPELGYDIKENQMHSPSVKQQHTALPQTFTRKGKILEKIYPMTSKKRNRGRDGGRGDLATIVLKLFDL